MKLSYMFAIVLEMSYMALRPVVLLRIASTSGERRVNGARPGANLWRQTDSAGQSPAWRLRVQVDYLRVGADPTEHCGPYHRVRITRQAGSRPYSTFQKYLASFRLLM